MSNIYVYKCVVDDGTAPCIDRSLLSMTVCKPKVRTSAKIGDFVLAFGTNAQPAPNRLVYAAKITELIPNAAYFDTAKFQTRQDCIYERTPQGALKLVAVHPPTTPAPTPKTSARRPTTRTLSRSSAPTSVTSAAAAPTTGNSTPLT